MPIVDPNKPAYAPTYSQLVESVDKLVKRNGVLADKIAAVRDMLNTLRIPHYNNDEDCWYSCPESDHCCDERSVGCNCGSGAHNAKIDAALSELESP